MCILCRHEGMNNSTAISLSASRQRDRGRWSPTYSVPSLLITPSHCLPLPSSTGLRTSLLPLPRRSSAPCAPFSPSLHAHHLYTSLLPLPLAPKSSAGGTFDPPDSMFPSPVDGGKAYIMSALPRNAIPR